MTKEPENLILRLLREMRDESSEIRKNMQKLMADNFIIKRRLDKMHETMYTAAGLAAHSNVRHDRVNEEIESLKQRVAKLEQNA